MCSFIVFAIPPYFWISLYMSSSSRNLVLILWIARWALSSCISSVFELDGLRNIILIDKHIDFVTSLMSFLPRSAPFFRIVSKLPAPYVLNISVRKQNFNCVGEYLKSSLEEFYVILFRKQLCVHSLLKPRTISGIWRRQLWQWFRSI